jgi:hypothetical protein
MNGQWLGEYSGNNTSGSIMVNLDDMGDYYAGVAFLVADPQPTPPLPALVAALRTRDKAKSFTYKISELGSIHPLSHAPDTWNNVNSFSRIYSNFRNKRKCEEVGAQNASL